MELFEDLPAIVVDAERRELVIRLRDGSTRTQVSWRPRAFRYRNAPWLEVDEITNEWVVDTEWWRERLQRHYFCVLVNHGSALFDIFRDGLTGGWHLSRRYD